jgi:DNA primase
VKDAVAGRIRDESIAELRQATDVVALVSEYVTLRPGGGTRMKGLCPFHQEKTPSFTVDGSRGLWHCLAGETRVLTWTGVQPIRDLAGGVHRILGRDGNWVDAPFHSFGVQPLMRIVLGRNGQVKELFATAEHRWFVRDGRGNRRPAREVVTRDLRPGHSLAWKFPGTRVQMTTPSPFGIAHGITYGDGSRLGSGSVAHLDPVKDVSLLKWFPNSFVTEDHRRILVHHLPRFFKELPPLDESVSYLYGWLAGYLAADGHVAKDGTVMLHCASRATLEYVRAVCTRLGIGTYGVTEQVREGFPGREPSSIFRIHLVNEDLTEEAFLLDEHRRRFCSARKSFARRGWVVRSVEPTDRVEEVFCAVVDQGHAFVLEDNILTGNCFGCGLGGDAIDFLMRQESLSFTEAVERLARRAGIELVYQGRSAGERGSLGRKSRLVAAHAAAVDFYHRLLLESPDARPARAYLSGRGFDRAVAERFRLGWAPARSWDALVDHLRGKGFRPEELTEAGLARAGGRGLRDAFHARVLFPIFDVGGDPVAFGGRTLEEGRGPKYLNTAETPVWHKGRALYALNWAKGPIVQAGHAVVVEGYTDVLACHAAGVPQTVATCGTALRAEHFRLLARFTGRVVLAFDADQAGGRAAGRGVPELIAEPDAVLSAHVVIVPEGLDPADFIARHGGEAFREVIDQAQPLLRWWIDQRLADFDLRQPEGKVRAVRELVPVMSSVPDFLQRNAYARSVMLRLGLDEYGPEYQALIGGHTPPRPPVEAKGPPRSRSPQGRVECEALKFALQHPAWTLQAAASWGPDWFTTPATSASFAALAKAGGPGVPLEAVLEAAANETDRRFLRGLAVEAFAAEENQGYADEVFRRLEEFRLTRVIDQLKGSLQRMNPVERPDEYTRSFEELIALEARRRALREPRSAGEGGSSPERTT